MYRTALCSYTEVRFKQSDIIISHAYRHAWTYNYIICTCMHSLMKWVGPWQMGRPYQLVPLLPDHSHMRWMCRKHLLQLLHNTTLTVTQHKYVFHGCKYKCTLSVHQLWVLNRPPCGSYIYTGMLNCSSWHSLTYTFRPGSIHWSFQLHAASRSHTALIPGLS